jgi:hypothetical protein
VWSEDVMWSTGGGEGEFMWSIAGRCGLKEMLCGVQEWGEGEVMWSTGGRCGVKERLCAAQV